MKKVIAGILLGTLVLAGCGKTTESEEAVSASAELSEAAESKAVSESEPETETESVSDSEAESEERAEEEEVSSSAQEEASETEEEVTPQPEDEVDLTPVEITFDESWEFAENSVIHTGAAVLYKAEANRKNIVIGVNAGHGCAGGSSVYTYCHPDQTPKVTGGSTAEGAVQATACATGMTFFDGTPEADVNLAEAQILKELLLSNGYDVLMIRDGEDVQLDNIARTLICNSYADCHIAIHWDGDGLDYDKGCYYMSVPDALKTMYPVSETWERSDTLGECLITGLASQNCALFESGSMPVDLTQTSYSTVPSIDIELGNAASDHSQEVLANLAAGLLAGVNAYFGQV